MNNQLIIKVTSPRDRIANGSAIRCTIGLIDALISAMNKANAAMPRIRRFPYRGHAGVTATMTAAAIVIINQLVRKLLMAQS